MSEDQTRPPIRLERSWHERLETEFQKPYLQALRGFLAARLGAGAEIYPRGPEYFRALDLTPFEQVRVVIIGQDPYHGPGQAHGLCFSVRPGVKPPPSLQNVYKELSDDLGITRPSHGYLEDWAKKGVLLLNAVLTVEKGQAGSHRGRGWEKFTDQIVQKLNDEREHLVFMLWGAYAQQKGASINRKRHLVLSARHPSPFSAHRGFFGCKHFSQANHYLTSHGLESIDWQLPVEVEEPTAVSSRITQQISSEPALGGVHRAL